MDKTLAFSILSSSPADISAAGLGLFSTRLSWRTSATAAAAGKPQPQPQADTAPAKQEKAAADRQGSTRAPAAPRPRFAPEFDGLNCFESIVSF